MNRDGCGEDNGRGQDNGHCHTPATPELDSLVLFGAGALALSGYGLYRRRSARRS